MSRVLKRVQCPQCNDTGKDNLIIYENGKHCFACGYREGSDNMSDDLATFVSGNVRTIVNRNLSSNSTGKFQYEVGNFTGYLQGELVSNEPVHIANYKDKSGNLVAQKIRASNKRMRVISTDNTQFSKLLYGQWLWSPNPNLNIIITEGEIDALSVYQVMGDRWAVVSIPNGCSGAASCIKENMSWLAGFKCVYLGFDSDEAGISAAQECSALFEPGKVKMIRWSKKDPNELLINQEQGTIKANVLGAEQLRPDSILSVEDVAKDALTKPEYGLSWPWSALTEATYGIHPNQIYTIGAGSGIGKTEFLKDIILHLVFQHQQKVGVIFLEQKPSQTLLRLVGGMVNKRLHVPGAEWDEEEIKKNMKKLEDKVFFYDHFGSQDPEVIVSQIRYMVKSLGCKYIALDHLTALASNMSDDRKGLDIYMSKFGGLVHELDCTMFMVSHLSKPINTAKSYEEGLTVSASAFRGSQSIQYWSSFIMGLERDKLSENELEKNELTVRILKDRFSGDADGLKVKLNYDRLLGKLVENLTDVEIRDIM